MPYSGWTEPNSYYGCGDWTSGIQIVNFTKDDLVKRASYGASIIGDTLVLPQGPYGVDLVDLTP